MMDAGQVWASGFGRLGGARTGSVLVAELLAEARRSLDEGGERARECLDSAVDLMDSLGLALRPAASGDRALRAGGLAPWQVRRVTGFIETHLETRIAVADLGAVARLSVSHFSRAFRQSFGVAPHVFLMRRRIERAQELMLETEEPLSAIALACGLADQAHLSRLFRRIVGQTPRRWRAFHRPDRGLGRA